MAGKLSKCCFEGEIASIKEILSNKEHQNLLDILNTRNGVFGYTPMHEAVSGNQPEVIKYLKEMGADINIKDTCSGFIPLHLAALLGNLQTVHVLLHCGADISSLDNRGKTPSQVADENYKFKVVAVLKSEEIIQEVKKDGKNLSKLLQVRTNELENGCLEKALMAAVHNKNHVNIGKLILKGAKNVNEALKLSVELDMQDVRVLLLLIKAAQLNTIDIVLNLFGESQVKSQTIIDYGNLCELQKIVIAKKVSTVVPIVIAQKCGNNDVHRELLLHTDVNEMEGYVLWHGLHLMKLEQPLFERISWVKKLSLARNHLKFIPAEIKTCFNQMTQLHIQHNKLTSIPDFILQIPNLKELNLSSNNLSQLPDICHWSSSLEFLDLSNNDLTHLPKDISAPSITTLLIASNKLDCVPCCVGSFLNLRVLDISENSDIQFLPAEMGRLSNLYELKVKGLKKLSDPPKSILRDLKNCKQYLRSLNRSSIRFHSMKLMIVGNNGSGKSMLAFRLQGPEPDHVLGMPVREWSFAIGFRKRTYRFNIWEIGSLEVYTGVPGCFFTERSMYLLLWNIKHGESGIAKLKPWLDSISLRAPQSCVLIVGTHLDEVEDSERPEIEKKLSLKIRELSKKYSMLQIADILAVGLMNRLENIHMLREAIYNCASEYKGNGSIPLMGQRVPSSYHYLARSLDRIQHEVSNGTRDPIMHESELRAFIQEQNLPDLKSDDEIKAAVTFLKYAGKLLCDEKYHSDMYFIDPRWVLQELSKLILLDKTKGYSNNGIILCSNIIPILNYTQLHLMCLPLLDHIGMVIHIDSSKIFIPFLLPDELPLDAQHLLLNHPKEQYYQHYISFHSPCPAMFWNQLLVNVLRSLPEILQALLEKLEKSQEPFFASANNKTSVPSESNCTSHGLMVCDIICWAKGLAYKSSGLSFCIESIFNPKELCVSSGISIKVSSSVSGSRILSLLTELTMRVIQEIYPSIFQDSKLYPQHTVPCYECMKLHRDKPFMFDVNKYMTVVSYNPMKVACGYGIENHTVLLTDVIHSALNMNFADNGHLVKFKLCSRSISV